MEKKNAYQELYPRFEQSREAILQAKRVQGHSIQTLVEESGVPYSAVSRLCDGSQSDPKLYNSVALCKTLGLSVDEIFGLPAAEGSTAELREQIHAKELEIVRLADENRRLAERAEIYRKQAGERKPVIYILLVLCAVLSCALGAYLIIDANIRTAGLIRFGNFSPAAWGFVGILVLAVAACTYSVLRVTRRDKNEK